MKYGFVMAMILVALAPGRGLAGRVEDGSRRADSPAWLGLATDPDRTTCPDLRAPREIERLGTGNQGKSSPPDPSPWVPEPVVVEEAPDSAPPESSADPEVEGEWPGDSVQRTSTSPARAASVRSEPVEAERRPLRGGVRTSTSPARTESSPADSRLVQLESTELEPPGETAGEIAYVQRRADRRYASNFEKYRMETGRFELRHGVCRELEVGLRLLTVAARLFTDGAFCVEDIHSLEPVKSLTLKYGSELDCPESRYAVGLAKSIGDSATRRYALPDDGRYTDTVFASFSRRLGTVAEGTVSAVRFWVPGPLGPGESPMDSLGAGLRLFPDERWTLGVEYVFESEPGNRTSGFTVLGGEREKRHVNASVRADLDGSSLEIGALRLDEPGYRQLDVAWSMRF